MAITNVGSGLKISSTGKVENVGELSMGLIPELTV